MSSLRAMSLSLRRLLRRSRLIQGSFLIGFWTLGETIARSAHLPIPGGIVGLAMVLILLLSGRMHIVTLRRGADWLLADMLLFFVPAVLAILNHREFLGIIGLKLIGIVLLGTLLVMGGTAFVVDLCCRMSHHDLVK
ncbi:MAG: CidA/LrgA family protein [Desulfoplanes sp.]|nr:CidA/LrgA family protein [Desulfoplanes sp.]